MSYMLTEEELALLKKVNPDIIDRIGKQREYEYEIKKQCKERKRQERRRKKKEERQKKKEKNTQNKSIEELYDEMIAK